LDSTTLLHKAVIDYRPESETETDTLDRIRLNQVRSGGNEPELGYDPIDWVEAISVHYGQRHKKEIEYAGRTCAVHVIKHSMVYLPVNLLGGAMLTDPNIEIPNVSYADLPRGRSPTYVPYRNGNLLSTVTSHAYKWTLETSEGEREAGVYFGCHAEDAHS